MARRLRIQTKRGLLSISVVALAAATVITTGSMIVGAEKSSVDFELRLGPTSHPELTVKSTFNVNTGTMVELVPVQSEMSPGRASPLVEVQLENRDKAELKQEDSGWSLISKTNSPITLTYRFDFSGSGTPDESHEQGLESRLPVFSTELGVLKGLDVFILPRVEGEYLADSFNVDIKAPEGDRIFVPWKREKGTSYRVGSVERLLENLIVWGKFKEYGVEVDSNELRVAFSASGRPSSSQEIKDYYLSVADILEASLDVFEAMPDLGEKERVIFTCLGPEEIDMQGSDSVTGPSSILFFNDSAKVEGSPAVTASRAIFQMWNKYGIIPADGVQGDQVLWFDRGLDQYYGPLLAARVGLLSARGAWARFSREYAGYASQPQARTMSLREAGSSVDGSAILVSKGSLACAALDSRIREVSDKKADLDNLLSEIIRGRNGYEGKRYTSTDLREYLQDMIPDDWKDFLSRLETGTGWFNLADISSSELFQGGNGGRISSGSRASFNWLWLILILAIIVIIPLIFTPYVRRASRTEATWVPSFDDEPGSEERTWDEEEEEQPEED